MTSTGRLVRCLLCLLVLVPAAWGPSPTVHAHAQATEDSPAATCAAAGLPASACEGVSSNDQWTPLFREYTGKQGKGLTRLGAGTAFTRTGSDKTIIIGLLYFFR